MEYLLKKATVTGTSPREACRLQKAVQAPLCTPDGYGTISFNAFHAEFWSCFGPVQMHDFECTTEVFFVCIYRSVYTIQSHAALSTWLVYKEMRLGNYTLESFPYSSLCNSDIYFVPLNVERCNLFLYRFIAKLVLGFKRNLKSLR